SRLPANMRVSGCEQGMPPKRVFSKARPLLPYAEAREDFAKQVFAGELAGDRAQRVVCEPQFFREQIQHLIVMIGMGTRQGEMLAGSFQGSEMSLAREPR